MLKDDAINTMRARCNSPKYQKSIPAFDGSEKEILDFLEHASHCTFHEQELKRYDSLLRDSFKFTFALPPKDLPSSIAVDASSRRQSWPRRLSTIEILKLGANKWHKWRQDSHQIRLCLVDAYLCGENLAEYDLSYVYLDRANLNSANLQNANLREAILLDASLIGANLKGADLRNADLRGANLSKAILTGANLSGANLQGANMTLGTFVEAKLRKADLESADLSRANLIDADFSGAYLLNTNLAETDISKAIFTGAVRN